MRPRWIGYALAVGGAALALALTQSLPLLLGRTPFAPFLIVIALLTVWAGAGPGLVAMVLGVVTTTLLLRPPVGAPEATGFFVVALLTIGFIHRHQRAVEALRESERRYQHLSELSSDVVIHDDLDGRVESINTAGSTISGYPLEAIIGQPVLDFIAPECLDRARQGRRALLSADGPKTVSLELDFRGANDRPLSFDTRTEVRMVNGRAVGFRTVARDVTERRRLEAQLRQSMKMEAVGRLAGGVAHDFNNVLTAIMGYVETALIGLGPSHPQSKDLRHALTACERAAQLVRQLLAFSRKQALQPVVLDPNDVVKSLESMLRRIIGADVILTCLPGATVGHIKADPNQLTQVLLNLAVNARDAMPMGGTLTIDTANVDVPEGQTRSGAQVEPGRYAVIGVTDTGHGMDADTQAHIFEPFFTTKPEGKGTGLGLATVYGIVKQSGGYIWVDSEVGRGTRFEIHLPTVDAPVAETAQDLAVLEALTGTETILLAEDDLDIRTLAAEALTDLGYTVVSAPDGVVAAEQADQREGTIDLVLTDIVMPWMSGPELVEQIRQTRPLVKVLFMSGFVAPAELQQQALTLDAPLLLKPFTPRDLAREVRKALDRT